MGPVLDVGDATVNKIVRIPVLEEFASKWETQMLDKLQGYLFNKMCDACYQEDGPYMYLGLGYMLWGSIKEVDKT